MTDNPNHSFFIPDGVRNSKYKLTPKEVILSLLRVRAMKQVDLADKIGISRQALNQYISGRWTVHSEIKIKIAEALGVDSSSIWDLEAKK